jgi:hypothetical protein
MKGILTHEWMIEAKEDLVQNDLSLTKTFLSDWSQT